MTNSGSSEQSFPSSLPAALLIHNELFLFSSKFFEYSGIKISQVASLAILWSINLKYALTALELVSYIFLFLTSLDVKGVPDSSFF